MLANQKTFGLPAITLLVCWMQTLQLQCGLGLQFSDIFSVNSFNQSQFLSCLTTCFHKCLNVVWIKQFLRVRKNYYFAFH